MSDSSRKRGLPVQVKMRHDTHFIEDLAARHGEPVGKMLAVTDVEPDPHQPRSSLGALDDLVASIRDKGVLEPILVRPNPDRAGSESPAFRIISGERRYLAAMEAGLVEVPAIEMDVEEDEALEIALIENLQRKDLTPFEEAEGYRVLGERHGYTHEQIADAVGRSRSSITECLTLLAMPPRARTVVQALGIQARSVLLEVVRAAQDEDEMVSLLEQVAERGMGRDDLRRAVKDKRARRTGTPSGRRKPYVFKFKAPDNTFSLALRFRRTTVDREDLIAALQDILERIRKSEDTGL